ncbi:hypothetical protein C3E97_033980, partial [Pseudomonas sp. MWU12-2115]
FSVFLSVAAKFVAIAIKVGSLGQYGIGFDLTGLGSRLRGCWGCGFLCLGIILRWRCMSRRLDYIDMLSGGRVSRCRLYWCGSAGCGFLCLGIRLRQKRMSSLLNCIEMLSVIRVSRCRFYGRGCSGRGFLCLGLPLPLRCCMSRRR